MNALREEATRELQASREIIQRLQHDVNNAVASAQASQRLTEGLRGEVQSITQLATSYRDSEQRAWQRARTEEAEPRTVRELPTGMPKRRPKTQRTIKYYLKNKTRERLR